MRPILAYIFSYIILSCSSASENESYPAPLDMNDGWNVASPNNKTIDIEGLKKLDHLVRSSELYTQVHSIQIAQNNKLIFDKYYPGWRDQYKDPVNPEIATHQLSSLTKTVASTVTGIAIDKGFLKGLHIPIKPFFSDYSDIDWSNNKDKITIEHLLNMTPGFYWLENYDPNLSDSEQRYMVFDEPDDHHFLLKQPMQNIPGTTFYYNTSAPVLLAGVVEKSLPFAYSKFAQEHLFKPLQISGEKWSYNSIGQIFTGGRMKMRPRDILKIGQLFLDNGEWNGTRIISSDWVKSSRLKKSGYKYNWQTWVKNINGRNVLVHGHLGYGGQALYYIPEFNAVVVSTAWFYDLASMQRMETLFNEHILKLFK